MKRKISIIIAVVMLFTATPYEIMALDEDMIIAGQSEIENFIEDDLPVQEILPEDTVDVLSQAEKEMDGQVQRESNTEEETRLETTNSLEETALDEVNNSGATTSDAPNKTDETTPNVMDAPDETVSETTNTPKEKKNANLKFESDQISMTIGDTGIFNKLITQEAGQPFTYISDNSAVKVDEKTGALLAVASGTAIITVKSASTEEYFEGEASYKVVVNKKTPILEFELPTLKKKIGDKPFTNTISEKMETDGRLTYKSSNPEVVLVDETTGQATIVGLGTAVISAESSETENYFAGRAEYKVEVEEFKKKEPILAFKSQKVSKGINEGKFINKLEKSETDGALTYSSSNVKVAIVDKNTGEVTLVAEGVTTITVVSTETANYLKGTTNYQLNVIGEEKKEITVKEVPYSGLYDGKSHVSDLLKVQNPVQNFEIYYSLSEALTKENYKEKGSLVVPECKNVGKYVVYYYITAKGYSDKSGQVKVEILPKSLDEKDVSLEYTSTSYNAKLQTPAVIIKDLIPDEDYKVTYKKNRYVGTAQVIIKGIGNCTGTVKKSFTIVKAKQKITVKTLEAEFAKNKTFSLGAKSTKGKMTFSSSVPSVATVSSSGIITMKSRGKTRITITAAEKPQYAETTASFVVTIRSGQEITASNIRKEYAEGLKFALNAKAKTKLSYESSNQAVATVDSAGVVMVKAVGKTTITISAAQTSKYRAATKQIVITIINPKQQQVIKASNIKRVYKANQEFKLSASAKGKLTFVSSDNKVVSVNKTTGSAVIKGTGKAIVTIKAAATTRYKAAQKKISVVIYPARNTFHTYYSPYSKMIKLGWNKDTQVTGYELQLSTDKNFTQKKVARASMQQTTTTIPNMISGRTYYVRIRGYKMSGETTVYGSWSVVRSIVVS
ncbi:MAG: fibronectin type III domain-containing protein [Eubacteriales bacterium]|nr:fibronectin type III domain-containing protein [Eubacteriales bacterium]